MNEFPVHESMPPRLTIEELAERSDVPVRTVRYYIAEGLLPGPGSRGKSASYTDEHLVRLRLIRRLAARRVPLGEIRDLLARLPADEARAVLREEARRAETLETHAAAPSPKEYIAALLEHAGSATPSPSPSPSPSPLAAAPARRPAAGAAVSASPPQAARLARFSATPQPAAEIEEAWRRWTLAPGVELHVRGDIASTRKEVIERLLQAARDALNAQAQEEN